ncbi:hypothetical protein TruAng_011521 [Truncatella angustata]|nr:hypothetical protein TruAng_011521 [Truncatella angustata]
MHNLVVPVESELPTIDFEASSYGNDAWSKIKFEDPNVTDEKTTMYQLVRSPIDADIENLIEEELRERITKWAGGPYEYRARGTRLYGWTKGWSSVFLVFLPVNNVDEVELYTTANNGRVVWRKISWCSKSYIILESEDDIVGNRQNDAMEFYMFRAWKKNEPNVASRDSSGQAQESETPKEQRQVGEVQDV